MAVGRPATPADRMWDELAVKLAADALPRVQSAAEKWSGTIAALTGILGIVAFVEGPNEVTELTGWYEYAVPVCLGLAILCAVIATVLAALVAQGVPEEFYATGTAVQRLYQTKVDEGIRRLNWSRLLALAAVVFLVLAVGLNWYGDRESGDPVPNVLIVSTSGQAECGTLARDPAGALAVEVAGTPVALRDVASVDVVDGCPE